MVEKTSQVNFADPTFKRRARFLICTSLLAVWSRSGELPLSSFFVNSLGFVSKIGSLFQFLYSIISFVSPRAPLLSLFSMIVIQTYEEIKFTTFRRQNIHKNYHIDNILGAYLTCRGCFWENMCKFNSWSG